MSAYNKIDKETFDWVKSEIDISLKDVNKYLSDYMSQDNAQEVLAMLASELHQVSGSLQILELRSLSKLLEEANLLTRACVEEELDLAKGQFKELLESAVSELKTSLERITEGSSEQPIAVVDLINQFRDARGQEALEISSLFSPMIDVFPAVSSDKTLRNEEYINRVKALRARYQIYLLDWLKNDSPEALSKITLVIDKLKQMSTFGAVARLWWVADAYVDYICVNGIGNDFTHSRVLRQLNERLFDLGQQGESALVRDPSDELIKIMLFFIGVAPNRTEKIDEISKEFKLEQYFPDLDQSVGESVAFQQDIQAKLDEISLDNSFNLPSLRQKLARYFESPDPELFEQILSESETLEAQTDKYEVELIRELSSGLHAALNAVKENQELITDETGFNIAAALLFVENSLDGKLSVDDIWISKGQNSITGLKAVCDGDASFVGEQHASLNASERNVLLDLISQEVDDNVDAIELSLENFSKHLDEPKLLEGIDSKVRQIRGALQVLGENRISLLMTMMETQFSAIEQGEIKATPELVEALAVAVGTIEEYVHGLQTDQVGMEAMLDRSITELEVAIGKKVSRDDVEELLENSSSSLFAWLENQSNFDLFTELKATLRDLLILSKKTKLHKVEELVDEQNRLIDIISQEPAFLSRNITATLQNNMASIAEAVIELYGTEETLEEQQQDEDLAYRKSAITADDKDATKIHDDMDVSDLVTADDVVVEISGEKEVEQDYIDDTIREVFIEESRDILDEANLLYKRCLEDENDRDAIRDLRRQFHTLKGSARMVRFDNVGEIAWFAESLFNYVLDTEKPLSEAVLNFGREVLDLFRQELKTDYEQQHLVDVDAWGAKTEIMATAESAVEEEVELAEPSEPAQPEIELKTSEVEGPFELFDLPVDISEESELSSTEEDDSQYGESTDIEENSFSVISDKQVREAFLKEGAANLQIINGALSEPVININDGSALFVAVHTFLGNSRIFDFHAMAEAYDIAEQFCADQHQNEEPLSQRQTDALKKLSLITNETLQQLESYEEEFNLDVSAWELMATELNLALQESDSQELVETNSADEIVIDNGENEWLDEVAVELEGKDQKPDKVSALFEELNDIDDLLSDNQSEGEPLHSSLPSEQWLPDDGEDLQDIENVLESLSLETETETETENFSEPGEYTDLASSAEEIESSDVGVVQGVEAEHSLIPEDLTHLIEDDLMDVEVAESSEDDEKLDVIEQHAEEKQINERVEKTYDVIDGVDEELRQVFLQEVNSIRQELDAGVAQLTELKNIPNVMPDIARHLHTVKGSAGMAEANELSDLTHHVESYIEQSFLRNADDLKELRNTLELYIDELDDAAKAYDKKIRFQPSEGLSIALNIQDDTTSLSSLDMDYVVDVEGDEFLLSSESTTDQEVDQEVDLKAKLSTHQAALLKVLGRWKSARGWKKIKPQLQDGIDALLVDTSVNSVEAMHELLVGIRQFITPLKLKNVSKFKQAKQLVVDALNRFFEDSESIIRGNEFSDFSDLLSLLNVSETNVEKLEIHQPKTPQAEIQKASITVVKPSVYDEQNKQAIAAQSDQVGNQSDVENKDIASRVSALRIQTETLDNLTNYVGDSSMNRSQMKEEVNQVKGVVEGLYENVKRFSEQLRELEIEADSRMMSRSNEQISRANEAEFDPLEFDRYTKLQQLSRGLTENLDELGSIQNNLSSFIYRTETALQKQDRLNRELQDELMRVRLVSFDGVASQLRQVVRRTARELNKQVELNITGLEVRLDKTILDSIVPALEHMLRNAVDHGIESVEERQRKGKSEIGQIQVDCRQVAREIIITVADDGAGIDFEVIRQKAITEQLITSEQELQPAEIMMLISQSGFTTADKVTQISGRGVGMDVVQSILRRMSGNIAFDSDNEQPGSRFVLTLPISLTVTSAVFVQSADTEYAISARMIERIVKVSSKHLYASLQAEGEAVLESEGKHYRLIDLADYLGGHSSVKEQDEKMSVVLVDSGQQNIAVIIDELLDNQEIVVKNMGEHIGSIPIYAGATIRADGRVVLLLDVVGISYVEARITQPDAAADTDQNIPTVLVVDDSLTVRKSAERDISALGLKVELAKDGIDAQEILNDIKADMILLDIEMPRMDGFEFLQWSKSNEETKDIPVVMISSRAIDKYIDKATDLGCSAFLGKPYRIDDLVSVFNEFLDSKTTIVVKGE